MLRTGRVEQKGGIEGLEAEEMVRAEFVSTLEGEGIERKERVGAPQWTLGVPPRTTQ